MNQTVEHPLAILAQLHQRARHADSIQELAFIMVNESARLLPYRQAILWDRQGKVMAHSGVARIEPHGPFSLWLQGFFNVLAVRDGAEARPVSAATLSGIWSREWSEWLPAEGVVVPLRAPDGLLLGVMLLARDQPWSEADRAVLTILVDGYAHALSWHDRRSIPEWRERWGSWRPGRRWAWLMAGGIFLAMWMPVRLSVIAPAEVVAVDVDVLRAPLDGVVDRFHIQPNARVEAGDPLFELDRTTLQGKLEVAEQALATAEAEHRQTAQQAILDPASKAQVALLASRIEERRKEGEYLRTLLERIVVRAPRAGVAVIDDPMAWIGRPVVTGERVMTVARLHQTEIEAWLAMGDLIPLESDAPLTLFLNTDPLHPVKAAVRLVAYEARERPDGAMAYRVRAALTGVGELPRVGLKGTARIDGPQVTLGYWLVRRPWAVLRQWLGL